ncbi:MAG TPA: hypothetical protein VHO50_04745 [Bacteroidales bacterium]|nr:hypothetical protein [Bacteroidales bacterium]
MTHLKTFLDSILKKYAATGLAFILVISFNQKVYCQCESNELKDECVSNLGTYNYLRTFNTAKKKAVTENVYVFSKGSTYKLIACPGQPGNKMIISLYDRDHKLIATSYNEASDKHYSELQYPCPATGVYYINTSIPGIKNGCGMCILGFSKEEIVKN